MKNPTISNSISHYTIIKILKKFSKEELKEFEKFLKSPFYNNHSTIVKIFSGLKKYYPEFENKELTKEYLFSFAGKGKKYNDTLFRKYLSRMNKLAEEYLNIVQMRTDKFDREINILQQLSKRDLKEVYTKKLKSVKNSLLPGKNIDGNNLLYMYQLDIIQFNYKTNKSIEKSRDDILFNALINLVGYFLFNSYSVMNQLISNKYSFKKEQNVEPLFEFYSNLKIEELLNTVKKIPITQNKDLLLLLDLILNSFQMTSTESGYTAYSKLKKLINENYQKLSSDMLYYFLQRMNVFCIIKKAEGNSEMNKDIFENYKLLIENDLFNFTENKNLTIPDFRQILFSALSIKEFVWTENFINKYSRKVTEVYGPNIIHFANALLKFHRSDYENALNYILKIKNEPLPIAIDIYTLKIKIFYHQGYLDSSLSVADSLRHFISGNKQLSEFYKSTILNFLKYYKKILNLNKRKDQAGLKKLIQELKASEINTIEKKWMIEIAEKLF
ncbi:MAG: hypothetical protein WAT71_04040 [Ignavibacteria bacterium]